MRFNFIHRCPKLDIQDQGAEIKMIIFGLIEIKKCKIAFANISDLHSSADVNFSPKWYCRPGCVRRRCGRCFFCLLLQPGQTD